MKARAALPESMCLRVTRHCNARCSFCLAPPDGAHPATATLRRRIEWLQAQGVRTLNLCGGEPTLHPGLPELLRHARSLGIATRLTTNGIALPAALPAALREAATAVKFSLHGSRAQHDEIVGRVAWDRAVAHLRTLRDGGVAVGVQTTLVAGREDVLDTMLAFCLAERVRQLTLLPFIPRGLGGASESGHALDRAARERLRDAVRRHRRQHAGRLDLRWLDFAARPLPVLEADGRIVVERAREALDTVIGRVPDDQTPALQDEASSARSAGRSTLPTPVRGSAGTRWMRAGTL